MKCGVCLCVCVCALFLSHLVLFDLKCRQRDILTFRYNLVVLSRLVYHHDVGERGFRNGGGGGGGGAGLFLKRRNNVVRLQQYTKYYM